MNCSDIEQYLLIDPLRLPPEVLAHLEGCPACRAKRAAIDRVNAGLGEVMKRPQREGLHHRLILAQRLRRRRWTVVSGLAASLLLGIAIGFMALRGQAPPTPGWGRVMAQHLLEDPQHERAPDPEAQAALRRVLADLGAREQAGLPKVLRAGLCVLKHQVTAHVVFDVQGEPVVAFLLPKEIESSTTELAGWTGILRPMAGGTIAVFARDPNRGRTLASTLTRGLRWAQT